MLLRSNSMLSINDREDSRQISHFSLSNKKNKTNYLTENKNNHINTQINSLDIDQYVADIICTAARKSSNHYGEYHSMRFYP
jgi:spore coat protein CotF